MTRNDHFCRLSRSPPANTLRITLCGKAGPEAGPERVQKWVQEQVQNGSRSWSRSWSGSRSWTGGVLGYPALPWYTSYPTHPGYTCTTRVHHPAAVHAGTVLSVTTVSQEDSLGSEALGSLGRSPGKSTLPRVVSLLRGFSSGVTGRDRVESDKDWIDSG